MKIKVTVVYEMEESDAQHLIEGVKTRQVLGSTGAIVACCQEDAMEERDAYKGFLARHGYSTDAALKGHQEYLAKVEAIKSPR